MERIFLLSPANCSGARAKALLEGRGESALALALRQCSVPISELFVFLSRLYFRGKLEYARRYARAPGAIAPIWVITPTRGLVPPNSPVDLKTLFEFSNGRVHRSRPQYLRPLQVTGGKLADHLGRDAEVVLLGSLASPKYLEPLAGVFGTRLRFPEVFVGLGEMQRGSLLLRLVEEGRELRYVGSHPSLGHHATP